MARTDSAPAVPETDAAPRILILRLSAIGDVVMASGIVPALRSRWPHAHIAWMVEPAAQPLLAHNPRIDRLIVWPRAEWRRLWKAGQWFTLAGRMLSLRRTLRDERFDIALDLQGLLKSAIWGWMSGAPRRICLVGREGSHLLATERVTPSPDAGGKRFGTEYRQLAGYLGATDASFQPNLAIGSAARDAALDALRPAWQRGSSRRLAVLCPFTTRPQKHWFEDRWVALAQRLQAAGYVTALLGGPGDCEAAARIAGAEPGIMSLVGSLRLDESAAVIAEAALLIGVDTGLTHMGTALQVPTVALFGSTRPYLNPMSPTTSVLFEDLACSPCRRNPTCAGRFDCMRALQVDQVMDAASRVASLL